MTMVSFEVSVNGKRICVAGTAPINRVLGASLSWTHRQSDRLTFHVGGIPTETDQHFKYNVPEIAVGDEILIRIVETDEIDEPDLTYLPSDRSDEVTG